MPSNVIVVRGVDQQLNASKYVQKVKVSDGGLFHKAGITFALLLNCSNLVE